MAPWTARRSAASDSEMPSRLLSRRSSTSRAGSACQGSAGGGALTGAVAADGQRSSGSTAGSTRTLVVAWRSTSSLTLPRRKRW